MKTLDVHRTPLNDILKMKNGFQDFQVILDNIRSAYNVGSILRTAEGFGINKIILGGITPTPLNTKTLKTSLGTEKNISWEYCKNCISYLSNHASGSYTVIGLENCRQAKPIWEVNHFHLKKRIVLIIGNENFGIDPELLDLCDLIVNIPMTGEKKSFNVATAFGIAAFFLLNRNNFNQ